MKGGRRCSSHPAAAGIRVAGGGHRSYREARSCWITAAAGKRLLAWLIRYYRLGGYPLDKFVRAIEAEALAPMKADWLQLPDTAGDIPPRRHHRRLTLAVLLGAAFLAGSIAGRALASTPGPGAQELIPAPHPSDPPALVVGRQPEPERRTEAPNPLLPTVTARPWPAAGVLSPRTNAVLVSGIASTYGPGYAGLTASRWPRGTVLRICGPGGCVTRTTNDYGPAKRTGRIVDLDVRTFELVCGCSWRRGLVRVTVELVA